MCSEPYLNHSNIYNDFFKLMQLCSISLSVRRLGGAYGSKISRNFVVAAGCALASNAVKRYDLSLKNYKYKNGFYYWTFLGFFVFVFFIYIYKHF